MAPGHISLGRWLADRKREIGEAAVRSGAITIQDLRDAAVIKHRLEDALCGEVDQ